MKFYVQNLTKCAPRTGILKDIVDKPNLQYETPTFMLHTQGGQIPNVTHEVFKLVSNIPPILQIPLVSIYVYHDVIGSYNGTLSEFIGNKDSITCLTLFDPAYLNAQKNHFKHQVSIWTRHGKVLFDADSYMNVIESLKPHMYYSLSDGDTNRGTSAKRLLKSTENTIRFYKKCLERHRESDVLKESFLIAPIVGGYCVKSREECLKVVLQDCNNVSGYLIDGLHNNGPEVELIPFDDIRNIVEFTIQKLPPEGLRSIHGCWNPVNIIKLVKLGIDFFDTSYCHILTKRGAVMTFPIENNDESSSFELNLRNPKYSEDFQPILRDCKCLTCANYSRAYIHHLLTVHELLGPVLIMIHNVQHFFSFFEKIRSCIKENSLDEYEQVLEKEFNKILVENKKSGINY